MIRRLVSCLTVLAMTFCASVALADPKPEAVDAIKWGLDYCKDGLKAEKDLGETQELYSKFQARLKTATAADPSIRTWNGEVRGMKVSEWIPRCEKDLSAKVQSASAAKGVADAVKDAFHTCTFSRGANTVEAIDQSLAEFKQKKAAAIAVNKGPVFTQKVDGEDPAAKFAACEKQMTETRASFVKRDADSSAALAAGQKRLADEQAAREKVAAENLKKRRASLKGDRLKIYDKYGEPTNWDGDLDKTSEWRWHSTHTLGGVEGDCLTIVRFKGAKKVGETESGIACKW